jgi:hypothetical protein
MLAPRMLQVVPLCEIACGKKVLLLQLLVVIPKS